MATFGTFGEQENPPTGLDVATRVDVQDTLLDPIIDAIATAVEQRIDTQEATLKPVYRTIVKDLQARTREQAAAIAPVGRRVITNLKARTATTGSMLDGVKGTLTDAGYILPTPFTTGGVSTVTSDGVVSLGEPIAVAEPMDMLAAADGVATGDTSDAVLPPVSDPVPFGTGVPIPASIAAFPAPIPVPTGDDPICDTLPHDAPPRGSVYHIEGVYNLVKDPTGRVWSKDVAGKWYCTEPPKPSLGGSEILPTSSAPVSSVLPTLAPIIPTGAIATTTPPVESPEVSSLPGVSIDWCVSDPCASANVEVARLRAALVKTGGGVDEPDGSFISFLTYTGNLLGTAAWSTAQSMVPGNAIENLSVGVGETVARLTIGAATAENILRDLSPSGIGDIKTLTTLVSRIGAGNMVASETGIPMDYLLNAEKYLLQYSSPMFIPEQGEIDDGWLRGRLTDKQWECYTKAHGNIPVCRKPVLEARSRMPEVLELISLYRRGHIKSKHDLYERCRKLGVLDYRFVDEWLLASQQLPTQSDLIHLTVRDAFDPNKLGRAEMLAEYNEQIGMKELYAAQGVGEFTIYTPDGRELTYNNAELQWIASYDEASPTQSYEGMHRLRPGRTHLFAQTIPHKRPDEMRKILPGADIKPTPDGRGSIVTPRPVTLYEVAKNLKEKDYNPIWRDMLAAISYRVIGRIDLRRFYKIGAFGQPRGVNGFGQDAQGNKFPIGVAEIELVERYMDEGYSKPDATLHAFYTADDWSKSHLGAAKGAAKTRVCKAYKLGVIDRQEALKRTYDLVRNEDEARFLIDQCDLDHQIDMVRTSIGITRKRFLGGEVGVGGAKNELVRAGVDFKRANELLDLWQLQLFRKPKESTAQQMCMWYNAGLLSRKDFKARLVKIGYTDEDADIVIKHCELGELARTSRVRDRLVNAQERERKRLLAAQEKEAQEREKARIERFMRFLRTRTEKNLKEWLLDQTITPNEVYTTLIAKGYSDADARRWLQHVGKSADTGATGGATGGAKEEA